jgi:RNA polymerase sigma-70 factor (ECF subfamily)
MNAVATEPSWADNPGPSDVRTAATPDLACSCDAGRWDEDFRAELLPLIPQLRAFARLLSSDRDSAEDLAQETLAKAWRHRHAYQPVTGLRAWLLTIARNECFPRRRRAWRAAPFDQAGAKCVPGNGFGQIWSMEPPDTLRALRLLPDPLREALVLVGAGGCSYEEAARICECPVGTAKSRVSRARRALSAILDATPPSVDLLSHSHSNSGLRQ